MQGPEFPGENFLVCGNTVTVQLSGGYTVTIITSGNTVTVQRSGGNTGFCPG